MKDTLKILSFSSMPLTLRLKRSVPEPAEVCEIHSMVFEGYACACAPPALSVSMAARHRTNEQMRRPECVLLIVSSFVVMEYRFRGSAAAAGIRYIGGPVRASSVASVHRGVHHRSCCAHRDALQ